MYHGFALFQLRKVIYADFERAPHACQHLIQRIFNFLPDPLCVFFVRILCMDLHGESLCFHGISPYDFQSAFVETVKCVFGNPSLDAGVVLNVCVLDRIIFKFENPEIRFLLRLFVRDDVFHGVIPFILFFYFLISLNLVLTLHSRDGSTLCGQKFLCVEQGTIFLFMNWNSLNPLQNVMVGFKMKNPESAGVPIREKISWELMCQMFARM